MALISVQMAEKFIRHTLTLVLQRGPDGLDMQGLLAEEEFLSRKTLGQLINILKGRAKLADDFEVVLAKFLKDRNTLAHDLDQIDGFDLGTPDGRAAVNGFLTDLASTTELTIKVFLSLGLSWQEQVGFSTPADERARQWIGEEFEGIANSVFFAKER